MSFKFYAFFSKLKIQFVKKSTFKIDNRKKEKIIKK